MTVLCLHGTPVLSVGRYAVTRRNLIRLLIYRDIYCKINQINFDSGNVLLTFDDGEKSNLTAAELLYERGVLGVFFINWATIGKPDKLTVSDLNRIANMGHIIGDHFLVHKDVRKFTDEEFKGNLLESAARFISNGLPAANHFAFPGGLYQDRHIPILCDAGFEYIHTTRAEINAEKIHFNGKLITVFHRAPFFQFLVPPFRIISVPIWKTYVYSFSNIRKLFLGVLKK